MDDKTTSAPRIAEIIGPSGRVHYRRPEGDEMVAEAARTDGYSVRYVDRETVEAPLSPVRRKLTSIKRRGGERTKAKLAGRCVRIWSGEHGAWWRPDCAGYTVHLTAAGVYLFEDAFAATAHCDRDKAISYEVVT